MSNFEHKIRETLAATTRGSSSQNGTHLPTSTPLMKYGSNLSAGAALGSALLATKTALSENTHKPDNTTSSLNNDQSIVPMKEIPDQSEDFTGRSTLTKPGICAGSWSNPLIYAAMPFLLLVEKIKTHRQSYDSALRAQLVREIQFFQQQLAKQQILPEDIHNFTYLLFAYIDENISSAYNTSSSNLTLLVEFYRDAWGGEKCFEHLNMYWQEPQKNHDILAFYDLILSLGFKGKYHMIERGPVLLADLRHQLDTLLYQRNPIETLADSEPAKIIVKGKRVTPLRMLGAGLILSLLFYGGTSWYLHDASRNLRNAIMAWTPPEPRKINIMTTLPQPLPRILNEGWLEARVDPRGWLLIFTSDGAFATGKSVLSQEFQNKRNIERLGEALSPWPGNLEVIGHTDSEPFRKNLSNSNLKLSTARAQVVADKLQEVMQDDTKYQRQITSLGKGDAEPLTDNSSEAGRRRNRRVDILWEVGNRGEVKAENNDVSPVPPDTAEVLRELMGHAK